jgi:Flp pilus assembly protein TadB
MEQVMHELYGNGQVGFLKEAREFFARTDERSINWEKHRNQRDQEIKDALAEADRKRDKARYESTLALSKKSLLWTIVSGLVGIAALAVTVLSVAATLYIAHHAQIEPADIFNRLMHSQVYTASQTTAGGTETPLH